jgi:23S rRNA pseudouridine1911/1915/1917 synthase
LKTTVNKTYTLFEFLEEKYPESPRTRIKKLMQKGSVKVNDLTVTRHSLMLNPGDIVEISVQKETKTSSLLPFPVLYEDDYVIAVDKPAGYSTSSIDGSADIIGTVNTALRDVSMGRVRAYVVHRLDKEVSGVLVFAKSTKSMDILKDNWKDTEKHYYAFVEGIPSKKEDTIKSWLVEDNKQKVHSTDKKENAKFSVTSYRITRIIGDNALLDVTIQTGRKNQIRVHLSDIGCPIIGDRRYGASDKFVRRIRLHAYFLSFPHPVSGKTIKVTSSMPEGFLVLKDKDEKYK